MTETKKREAFALVIKAPPSQSASQVPVSPASRCLASMTLGRGTKTGCASFSLGAYKALSPTP
jgi:hypothetical protein